jgi:hypothetical protein
MAFFHSPNVSTDGLILSLDAANPKSYPGSGNTWYDLSGNGHHATLYSGVSYGLTGGVKSLICDGTDDWIGNTTLTGGHSNFTLELMFYHNGLDQGGSYGILSMGANGNYGPMFYCHTSCMGSHYFPGSPSGDYPGGMGYWSNNTWNIFTWVFSNTVPDNNTGDLKTYINGVYNSGTSNFNFHNSGMGRGSNGYALGTYSGGSAVYKGSFSQFRVYNRALSAAEVLQNYNANKQRYSYVYSEGNNAAPYVGNWNNTTTYTMNQFGGLGKVNAHGFSSGPVTYTLTLSSLPVHTEVRYKVFWHLVDSLDNETNQLFTMNSSGGETEKLRFTKQYNLEPAISVQDSGVIAPWSGPQTYTYRPWANGYYGQDGYLSIDTGWYAHTANSFTARHVMGADQGQTDEAEYLSHVQVYLR